MKNSIIVQVSIFLIFFLFLSCQQQDSTIVSPGETFELNKKKDPPTPPPGEGPVQYKVSINAPAGSGSSYFTSYIDGDANSQFLSVFWEGHEGASVTPMRDGVEQYPLDWDPFLNVMTNNQNQVIEIQLWIKSGPRDEGGKMHSTNVIPVSPTPISPGGFTVTGPAGPIPIYAHSNFKGGKRNPDPVGNIYIDQIVYTPN